jgi:hypothetical protein
VTAAFWGTLAGVLVLFFAAMWVGINTPEPAGAHHKPPRPPLRQRHRDRRQAERDRDEARDILAGQHMDTMPPDWTLMPLPPEVDEDEGYEPFVAAEGWREEATVDADPLAVLGDDDQADEYVGLAGQPAKNGSDAAGLIGPLTRTSLPSPAPRQCRSGQGHGYDRCPGCDACRGCHPHDPGPGCLPYLAAVPVPRDDYTDLAAGQYAEATGQFSRALLGEYERAHAGGTR